MLPTDKSVYLEWERVRLFDKEVAQMFVHRIKCGDGARVLDTVQKKGDFRKKYLRTNRRFIILLICFNNKHNA